MLLYFFAFLVAVASAGETFGFGTGLGVDLKDPKNPVISTGVNLPLGKKGTVNAKTNLGVGTKGVSTGISGGLTKNDDPMPREEKKKEEIIESTTSQVWTSTVMASSTLLPKKVRRSQASMIESTTHIDPSTTSKLLEIILPSTTFKPIVAPVIAERPQHDFPAEKKDEWTSSTFLPPMTSSFPVEVGSDEDERSREEIVWPASSTVVYPADKKHV